MTRPWLSVLLPTYNGCAYLASALESVAAQGDPDIEIIAVDDGSTDTTVAVLQSYAGRLPLRIFQTGKIGKWAANTNYALGYARGEHLCLLHQDDLWLPGRLGVLKRLLRNHPGAVMLLHPSWYIDAAGRRVGFWPCPLPAGRPLPPAAVLGRLLVQNFIAAPAPLFRKDAAAGVGGLDPDLWYATDWDLWLKLAAAGPTVYHPRPLTAFRIHTASQSLVCSKRVETVERELTTVLEKHLRVWERLAPEEPAVRRAASFSVEVNSQLLGWYHGHSPRRVALLRRFLALGPAAWHRYFHDSCVVARVLARLRAGVVAGLRRGQQPHELGGRYQPRRSAPA